MEYLLIDGYNLINSWRDVFDLENDTLEECRGKLLHIVSNYQGYKNANVIVVFDAHLKHENKRKIEKFDHITVVFTKKHETADNYIERFVYKMGANHIVRVVTSDYLEQRLVLNYGGIRITPSEFRKEVMSESLNNNREASVFNQSTNSVLANADPELLKKLDKMRKSSY